MDEKAQISEMLSAYLDGELRADDAARVEAAVAAGADLAAELAGLRKTRELLAALPRVKAPDDFVAGVLARAERVRLVTASREPAPRNWGRWVAAAASVAIATTVGAIIIFTLKAGTGTPLAAVKSPGESYPKLSVARDGMATSYEDKFRGAEGVRLGEAVTLAGKAQGEGLHKTDSKDSGESGWNFVIYTDDIPTARRDVECVLACNGFNSIPPATHVGKGGANVASNFIRYDNDEQVQYVVNANGDMNANLRQVAAALEDVRKRQRVSQDGDRARMALQREEQASRESMLDLTMANNVINGGVAASSAPAAPAVAAVSAPKRAALPTGEIAAPGLPGGPAAAAPSPPAPSAAPARVGKAGPEPALPRPAGDGAVARLPATSPAGPAPLAAMNEAAKEMPAKPAWAKGQQLTLDDQTAIAPTTRGGGYGIERSLPAGAAASQPASTLSGAVARQSKSGNGTLGLTDGGHFAEQPSLAARLGADSRPAAVVVEQGGQAAAEGQSAELTCRQSQADFDYSQAGRKYEQTVERLMITLEYRPAPSGERTTASRAAEPATQQPASK